jgi:lactose/L-arabinose transport system permease protein
VTQARAQGRPDHRGHAQPADGRATVSAHWRPHAAAAFTLPALVLVGLFMVYPVLWSLWMSFQTGRGMNLSFGGLANIERLSRDPVLWRALSNTFLFLIVQVPVMIALALLLAVALNDRDLRFKWLFRTAIFLPCVTSLVTYSVLFKSMFAQDGVVNAALLSLGLAAEPINWLGDPFWARVVVILAITWRWTGYNVIFFLAALQTIDPAINEQARIDGVPARARLWHLTVPMLRPMILFTAVMSTIGTLQLFDEVVNITQGGPADATLTLSLYIYNLAFKFMPNFGYAATVSYLVVILVGLLTWLQFRAARDR